MAEVDCYIITPAICKNKRISHFALNLTNRSGMPSQFFST